MKIKREPRSARRSLRQRLLPLLITGCFTVNVLANPLGPQVVNGQVNFATQGNTLSITNTPGAIINWHSFSINPGELTRFIQQNPNSAVLNRIVGQDPSQILGALQSNGKVFLINPNGILFGQGAQVDVNGLVASTLSIGNDDFLNGRMRFSAGGIAGNLSNQGAITTPSGGQVYLIAPNVENSGLITSPKGEVLLAAGHTVSLVDSANPDLHVTVSAPEHEALNLGQIIAQGGRTGIYGALIKQRGIVNADSAVVGENGRIVFKASGDTLLEAGSRTTAIGAGVGGEIRVLGERVGLTGDAQVDASGQAGGGTVLIGGDYQGKNANVQNARQTYVGKDANIKADATQAGNGGKVIVWGNDTTRYYGNISARGGAVSGDGGFAEVSGKQYLDFRGRADLRAPNGKAGTLLLDPNDISIQTDGPSGVTFSNSLFGGGPSESILTVDDLRQQLDLSDVSVTTASGSDGPNGGRIAFSSAFTWTNSHTLKLVADKDIVINAPVSGVNGTLALDAGGSVVETTAGSLAVNNLEIKALGSVSLNASNEIKNLSSESAGLSLVNSGDLRLGLGTNGITSTNQAVTIVSGGLITVKNPVHAGTGNVTLEGTSVDIGANINGGIVKLIANQAGTGAISTSGSASTITAGSAIGLVADNVSFSSSALPTFNAPDGVAYVTASDNASISTSSLTGATYSTPFLLIGSDIASASTTTGNITVDAAINRSGQGLVLLAGGSISQTAPITAQELTVVAGSVSGASGSVALDSGNAVTHLIGQTSGGAFSFTNASTLNVSTITSGLTAGSGVRTNNGALNIATSAGDINIAAPVVAGTGSVGLTASAGAIVQQSGGVLSGAALTASASSGIGHGTSLVTQVGSLTASNSGANNIGVINSGALTLQNLTQSSTGAGSITLNNSGAVTIPSTGSVTSGSGLINLVSVGPMAVNGSVTSNAGEIALSASATGSTTDTLTIGSSGVVSTNSGNILLAAGNAITITNAGSVSSVSGVITQQPFLNGLTLAQCILTPTVTGCSEVLPALTECTATPTLEGCSVVLPTLTACTATPTLEGCSAVLPTLTACTTTPTLEGCSAVLPTLSACTTTPTLAGCSAVLPTLTACTATPTLEGCSAVLPTLSACTTTPTLAGCSAVLPTLTACTTTPTLEGCSAVLPTLSACTTTPTLAGCSAVLPTLTACTATPTLEGCSAVLPTLTACTATPTLEGCAAVLPTATQCAATPTLAGCPVTTAPPTLSQCIAEPTLSGCSTVLPALSTCIATPTLEGCTAVLPTASQCAATPTLAGCPATTTPPTLSQCIATPTLAGCSTVLPSTGECVKTPTLTGCKAVLPTLSACIETPTLAGCSAVLPTSSQCDETPTLAGCSAAVTAVRDCVTHPSLSTCSPAVVRAILSTESTVTKAAIVEKIIENRKEEKKKEELEKAVAQDDSGEKKQNAVKKKMSCN